MIAVEIDSDDDDSGSTDNIFECTPESVDMLDDLMYEHAREV